MSTREAIANMQQAEEVRQRILASPSDGPTIVQKPTPAPPKPTAEDRRLAYESARSFVERTGRLVVGDGEDMLRLELRCRGGGQLLSDSDVDELVSLAKRLGAGRETSEYVERRAAATRYVDQAGRAVFPPSELAELLSTKFGLNEADVRSLVRRARGEL